MRRLANQRGVAMVTVLFIGMVLTVVVSSAAFITVREVSSGRDDSRAGRALTYAEAGVDRAYQWLRSNSSGWKYMTLSGCPFSGSTPTASTLRSFSGQLGTGTVNVGTFTSTIQPDDPTNSYCSGTIAPVDTETGPPLDTPYRMKITSTGTYGTTTKVVRQVVELGVEEFPIGMSANTIDSNGNGTIRNMSVITTSTVTGRDKIDMEGTDFFYTKSDFYPTIAAAQASQLMPASVHTVDRLLGNGGRQAHPPNLNCNFDKQPGDGRGSGWDGSSRGGTISSGTCADANPPPPTSKFTLTDYNRLAVTPRISTDDHLFYKSVAQSAGIYCNIPTSGATTCTRLGTTDNNIGTNVSTADVTNNPSACPTAPCTFVAYFEFQGGNALNNRVNWDAATPSTCSAGLVVLIIKNGSTQFGGNARFSGAIFAEDGRVTSNGGPQIEGTVIAKDIQMRGNPIFSMSACWLQNLPGPFLRVTALRWSEADR
ncbi:MAG TPA: pilus assembly PilX N-terminal domain-containing protein [Actinomycetota bacterium]|nr:pilus assembly PilX N-terminal domain-containing protein [Actinomycetota bacterium]